LTPRREIRAPRFVIGAPVSNHLSQSLLDADPPILRRHREHPSPTARLRDRGGYGVLNTLISVCPQFGQLKTRLSNPGLSGLTCVSGINAEHRGHVKRSGIAGIGCAAGIWFQCTSIEHRKQDAVDPSLFTLIVSNVPALSDCSLTKEAPACVPPGPPCQQPGSDDNRRNLCISGIDC
jgi:hypothetical protein